MDAATTVEVGLDARGRSVARRLSCEAPLLVRVADEPGPAITLLLVNGAAGPLGGDRLRFRLDVGPGAHAIVRSVAATMAQPGPRGEPSQLVVELSVGRDATLHWAPEPTVSVAGSEHRTLVRLAATSSSTVTVRDGVSLGRLGEGPGRLALRQRVEIDGSSVLDHETVFEAGALLGPGAHGASRWVTSEVVIGAELPVAGAEVRADRVSATYHLSPICSLTTTGAARPV